MGCSYGTGHLLRLGNSCESVGRYRWQSHHLQNTSSPRSSFWPCFRWFLVFPYSTVGNRHQYPGNSWIIGDKGGCGRDVRNSLLVMLGPTGSRSGIFSSSTLEKFHDPDSATRKL